MWPQSVEMILARQLASYLSMPIFLVDPAGDLLFYNPAAEQLLGMRFEETGQMNADEWSTVFDPIDTDGSPLPPDSLPLMITLTKQKPAHRVLTIRGKDGVERTLHVTALPLTGTSNRFVGAMAIFWERGA